MKINREELLNSLEVVKSGIGSAEKIEQSDSFAFLGDRVVSYNDEISISHPVTSLDIEGAIQANEFYKLLYKLQSEFITFTVGDNEITIKAGRSKSGIKYDQDISLPIKELTGKKKWVTLPDEFNRLAQYAVEACSKDRSEPVLSTVNITKDGYIQGSDGLRIMHCDVEDALPVEALIPASSMIQVLKIKPTKVFESRSGWVHFTNEEKTIISCRSFDDTYPEVLKHLKVRGTKAKFGQGIIEALEKASIFTNQSYDKFGQTVEVTLSPGEVHVRGESDAGWFEETGDAEYEGDEAIFLVAPFLIMNILRQTRRCTVGERSLRFRGKGWQYLSILQK